MPGPVSRTPLPPRRRHRGLIVTVLLGVVVAVGLVAKARATHPGEDEIPGQVHRLEGDVTNNRIPARSGEFVRVGDVLQTGAGGHLLLSLVSDGALRIAPSTHLSMRNLICHGLYHDLWIDLAGGRVWVDGRHGCNACFHTAHGSVRPERACYEVMDTPEETTVWVWRGRALVFSADEPNIGVAVERGQWAKIFKTRVNLGLITRK
ncbi:MAG: FecR family protein [Candidatus Xenobia bacterium]